MDSATDKLRFKIAQAQAEGPKWVTLSLGTALLLLDEIEQYRYVLQELKDTIHADRGMEPYTFDSMCGDLLTTKGSNRNG